MCAGSVGRKRSSEDIQPNLSSNSPGLRLQVRGTSEASKMESGMLKVKDIDHLVGRTINTLSSYSHDLSEVGL